jgi:ubiquitin thioesterase OTU1
MRIRLRGPGGTSTITLPDGATVGDLIAQITEKTSISNFECKIGYPPKPFPLEESEKSLLLSKVGVKLDSEQLTISERDDGPANQDSTEAMTEVNAPSHIEGLPAQSSDSFSFTDIPRKDRSKPLGPVSLQRKIMEDDVPELALPERGATLGMPSTRL